MASIRIKNKATTGGTPSGLTQGELAVNLADKTLYVGGTVGNSIYLSGVQTFNGLTGDVSGVTLGGANVFTQLNTFSAGLSASGATLGYIYTTNTGINNVIVGNVIFTYAQFLPSGYVFSLLSDFQKGISASGATVGTLVVSNGISAAGGITLASPNLVGTPTATTAPVGDNSLRIATTAYVQQEIANEGVTSFNGRTGAVQGVSAAVPGDGISVSGATGTVTITNTGVTRAEAGTGISISGNTGTVTITNTGALLTGNTFTGLQTFTNGISAAGGITFNSLSHFTAGLSGSGATLGTLIVHNGISASGGITFINILYVGQTLQANGNITLGGDLYKNGDMLESIVVYGTTADLPRPGSGMAKVTDTDPAAYGYYVWDDDALQSTGAWIRLTNSAGYQTNLDYNLDGIIDSYDLAALLAQWETYSGIVTGSSTTLTLGLGNTLANAFEIKVQGLSAGKKASAFKITSDQSEPYVSFQAAETNFNSRVIITDSSGQPALHVQTGRALFSEGVCFEAGTTFAGPVYMGATLTMNSNIRFNSGYGITGGFVDAGWY